MTDFSPYQPVWTTGGNNPCYSEHPDFPNGHRYSAMVGRNVSGTYQIFILDSHDWGQTWAETQITFKTGGSAYGHQYIGSICPDLDGRGLHISWYGKGYHSHPHMKYYPSQNYVTSLLYKYRDAYGVWSCGNCTPYEHDASLSVIEYSGDHVYAIGYSRFRYQNIIQPSMATDSQGDVHIAYSHWGGWNPFFSHVWYNVWYRKMRPAVGTWGSLAYFRWSRFNTTELERPNLQVDYYDNPHICCTILHPTSSWPINSYTSCWFMNWNKGDPLCWPGTPVWMPYIYGGQFPVASPYAQLLWETPSPNSYYNRMALSHFYDEGTFDYPHCIYAVSASGVEAGVFHKYMDVTGWHTERVNSAWNSQYPLLTLGADGMIYSLALAGSGTSLWDYRKKASPELAWSAAERITGLLTSPRPVHLARPTHYPLEDQDCSPFMAIQNSIEKLFRCGMPASGFGYFM